MDLIIDREGNLEPSLQGCLNGLGISRLCELDVLIFMYRHSLILARSEQIASLVGHELTAVGCALQQLEREKLIKRSRSSQEVFLFRFLALEDAERKYCLRQLISLLESRVGRVTAVSELKLKLAGIAARNLSLRSGQ